ncbi:MAG: acyltransferase [Novosphingobium sp.]|nr:acyltransferase [Novosphingobium sp.]
MTHHLFFFFAPWQFSMFPLAQLASWLQHFGWTLVDLFFVLSGYVFAHVYLRNGDLDSGHGISSFWVSRLARLWPLHLTMLILIALVDRTSRANTYYAFIAHVAMLQAFVSPVAGTYDWSSWSLSVEMLCYVIFSASAARGRKVLLCVTAVMILVSLVGLMLISQPGGPYAGGVFRRGLLGFFLGQAMWHCRGSLSRIPSVVLVTACATGLCFETGPYSPVLPLTLVTWPALLLLALRLPVMESPALVWLGDHSYAIYLINLPLVQAVVSLTHGHELSTSWIVAIQAAIVMTALVGAKLSFQWIEAPARRAIRQLWARQHRTTEATSGEWREGYT